ncbi:MAG: rhamnulokinase family protein [Bryobacterales bacterium]|nr:rhamnulokinase family protein [Bryobacterales bacterium]
MKRFLAFDLGAESGRGIVGILSAGNLALREIHRFANTPVRLPQGLFWDSLRLFHEIEEGIRLVGKEGTLLDGIGVDTWGVDFGLTGQDGTLVENPRCYRDARTDGILEAAFARMPKEEIYARTGIQFLQFNTLFQLYAMQKSGASSLAAAHSLLMMPDLLNFWLSGKAVSEITIASTSQIYDPTAGNWDRQLLESFGVSSSILLELVPPGSRLGTLVPHLAETTRVNPETPIYAAAGHDTACAVAAVPAAVGGDWCYISSGTWSLMGAELDGPVVNASALSHGFTNEVGVGGRIRFLKNIMGLWLLQECRRAWAQDGMEYSYEELVSAATNAEPFLAVVDPDAFLAPGHMPGKIRQFCAESGQRVPEGPAQMTRVILESLAVCYRKVLEDLEETLGRKVEVVHIVGGGSRNRLLNQFVADVTGRFVVAGPAEATAIGNVLVQAMGNGELQNLDAAREVVKNSFEVRRFEPQGSPGWESAYARFRELISR